MCFFIPQAAFLELANQTGITPHARDALLQTAKISAELYAAEPPQAVEVETGSSEFRCSIYSMSQHNAGLSRSESTYHRTKLSGIPLRTESQGDTADADLNNCIRGFKATYDFYKKVFKRNSIDDKGMHLVASIHYMAFYQNALWVPHLKQMVFGDGGTGRGWLMMTAEEKDEYTRTNNFHFFTPSFFTNNFDVIGHELTHGVIQMTAGLKYEGEAGALNESIADVFGSMIVQWHQNQSSQDSSWLVGKNSWGHEAAKIMGSPHLRCMSNPNLCRQPKRVGDEFWKDPTDISYDFGGVHTNSGVPSHAFYLICKDLDGNSWDKAGHVWYQTLISQELKDKVVREKFSGVKVTFLDFANITVSKAHLLFNSSVADSVAAAWDTVGVKLLMC